MEEALLEVVSEWDQCFKNHNAHLGGKQEKTWECGSNQDCLCRMEGLMKS